jgi:hypothetical protein
MTDAEQQEVFARLERLERSNWRWKVLATVLGVCFLLLLSLGLVSAVAMSLEVRQRAVQARMAEEEARRQVEEAAAQQRQGVSTRRVEVPPPQRMPKEPAPGKAP